MRTYEVHFLRKGNPCKLDVMAPDDTSAIATARGLLALAGIDAGGALDMVAVDTTPTRQGRRNLPRGKRIAIPAPSDN